MSQNSNISYLKYIKKIGVSSFLQDKPNNFYNINKSKEMQESLLIPKNISQIKEINHLKIFIKKLYTDKLGSNSKISIIGDGNEDSNIMFIGQSPKKNELNSGKLLINTVGALLEKMLNAINLKREELYFSNIFPWEIKHKTSPTNEQILECLPFIQKLIEIINPKIIILFGDTPAKAILNSNLEIAALRGKWHNYKTINSKCIIKCLATYHPEYLIDSPEYKKYAWNDLQLLQQMITDENL